MLCVVPSVPSSCTFIKLYQTVVNIKIDPEEIVTGCFGRILGRMDYKQEGQFWKFILGFFLLSYQEQVIMVVDYYSSALP